ncbi:MAG: phytanoyl-CoA dioxygenase family protein [Parvibaculum sp.]|jgi:ectoine hydroxylase-related dioxygenase (phytanoyl-CoA dioxygenase family)|uniref:phytanoyl-CoA dioxygenase family protein n=1 Tax=Parvibaculum sp. TaxID=2024848 RepID=UPI003266EE34
MSGEKVFPKVETLQALGSDLAGTHKASHSEAARKIDPAQLAQDKRKLEEDGYVIIESLLSAEEIAEIKAALLPLLGHTGRNAFEGVNTQRLYGVPEKTRATDRLIEHPRILALLDRLFLPNYLLSQCQAINIMPGEEAQYLHSDDGFYRVPRPRPPLGAATVWAIDDFTGENGATVVVPGSHTWPDGRMPGDGDRKVKAVMPAGSVVFYPGTLWHGGGANLSAAPRLAVTCQYCEPWLRTQENYFLCMSKETLRDVSEDMKRMLGYSIHPPFIGMVNGMHPKRVLEEGVPS